MDIIFEICFILTPDDDKLEFMDTRRKTVIKQLYKIEFCIIDLHY